MAVPPGAVFPCVPVAWVTPWGRLEHPSAHNEHFVILCSSRLLHALLSLLSHIKCKAPREAPGCINLVFPSPQHGE